MDKSMSPTLVRFLFLSADPTAALDTNVEFRRVYESIQGLSGFEVLSRNHVYAGDLQRILREIMPDVIHFSGHGVHGIGDLVTQRPQGGTHVMPLDALAEMLEVLKSRNPTRLIVLNACWSLERAEILTQVVDAVVGMTSDIGDDSAAAFAEGLYLDLCRGGNLDSALRAGKAQIKALGLPNDPIPAYLVRKGLDPAQIRLVEWYRKSALPRSNTGFLNKPLDRYNLRQSPDELKVPLLQRIDVFISSPSDVWAEREAVIRVIKNLNDSPFIRDRYVLNPLAYEKIVPPESGAAAQMIVNRFMTEPQHCYIVICVLWMKMGTPFIHPETRESFESGTEYEFTQAYRSFLEKGVPHILLYRRIDEPSGYDELQRSKVDAFFKRFHEVGSGLEGLYQTYSSLDQFEGLTKLHIETLLTTFPPPFETANRSHVEEKRRLDAAMPRQASVGKATEVWIQICLPESQGFRLRLPEFTKEGDLIDRQDVREGDMSVLFPIDPHTGQVNSLYVQIELKAPDFAIEEPIQEILLSPNRDSSQLTFMLIPRRIRAHSLVHIMAKSRTADGKVVILGSASLGTEIRRNVVSTLWNVLSLPFAVFVGTKTSTESMVPRAESTPDPAKRRRSVDILPSPFNLISVPSGRVMLGGNRWSNGGFISKATIFHVEPFAIAKYPVTNAQFRLFVEAGAYRDPQWWTEQGWTECQQAQWSAPRYWTVSDFNGAEQPVVGISWFEAVAFCRWLSSITGISIMLPTEQQWQWAAQGPDNRAYPWGEQFDPNRANFDSAGRTLSVLSYESKGESPFGVVDMCGNVWEWCSTDFENGTNELFGSNSRVMKGGSWAAYDPSLLRNDVRRYNSPYLRSDEVGFRICHLEMLLR